MANEKTRRDAMKTIGATLVITSVPGCGAALQTIQQVLVRVPWVKVLSIVSSILTVSNRTLAIAAQLDGEAEPVSFKSTLIEDDAKHILNGAQILIRTKDGTEFDVTPTINN